jgi:predicted acetyltransferase
MLEALYDLNSYSLYPSPPLQNKEEWIAVVRGRQGIICQAVFEDETPVSVVVSTPMMQNMRGKLFAACGVWGVSTAPSARRKGYCRQAMGSLLSVEREAGRCSQSLSVSGIIHERLGYVAFPLMKIARFRTLASFLKMELVRSNYSILATPDTYHEYIAEMRMYTQGMAFSIFLIANASRNLFRLPRLNLMEKSRGSCCTKLVGEEGSKFNLPFAFTIEPAGLPDARWIARHIDQADRVELWLQPDEFPETWLADAQMKVESSIRPGMSRVLDVEKIGGMQVGEGRFSARVSDPLCTWNDGVWNFESRVGILQVSRAATADCQLTIQGLAALIAGMLTTGYPYAAGIRISTPNHIARNVPQDDPYLHENF